MRLSAEQVRIIKQTVAEQLGSDAEVRLFGSRVDDRRRGGDIDLFVELHQAWNPGERLLAQVRLAAALERRLGGQRVDVVLKDAATPEAAIYTAARSRGVVL